MCLCVSYARKCVYNKKKKQSFLIKIKCDSQFYGNLNLINFPQVHTPTSRDKGITVTSRYGPARHSVDDSEPPMARVGEPKSERGDEREKV